MPRSFHDGILNMAERFSIPRLYYCEDHGPKRYAYERVCQHCFALDSDSDVTHILSWQLTQILDKLDKFNWQSAQVNKNLETLIWVAGGSGNDADNGNSGNDPGSGDSTGSDAR